MKVIKSMPLTLLTRCFEFRGRSWMSCAGVLMVDTGSHAALHMEKDLWAFWATRPEAALVLDESILLGRAEYLVSGVAYPHGTDGRACAVEAQVGGLKKRLLVYGDRYWDGASPTQPLRFSGLPLTWTRAYGGKGFADNPVGKGFAPTENNGVRRHELPNIEDPRQPIVSPRDRVLPVGFGPIDPMWPQRARYQGTYDDAWLKTQFPAVAADTDWRHFNRAPEDQQQSGPFTGVEEYVFHNLHPTIPVLQGRLPGLNVRVFVTQRSNGIEKFKEMRTRLNTLWFFPDAERVILIFQGMHEVAEDDGADIVHLMAALEYLDQPRAPEHYLHVRDKRLDRESGAIEALREEDLMPADLVVPLMDFTPRENRGLERGQKRAEVERAKARAEVASHGLDPDVHAPPVQGEQLPEINNLDDLIRVRAEMEQRMAIMKQQAEQEKARSLAEVRALFEREGKDFSLIEREMAGLETRGPPKPFVDDLLQSFHGFIAAGQDSEAGKAGVAELEDMVANEKLQAGWRLGESNQLKGYRMTAHYQIPVDRASGAAAQAMRHRVMAEMAAKGNLQGWDLTGADLSGLDLSGANLTGALMEHANLTGTDLSGANLSDAVLAHADLVSANLRGALLTRINLGAARIENTDFENADLTEAVFAKAVLSEVSWRGARLDDIRLEDARMASVDCSGARADSMLVFNQLDLRGFGFAAASLKLAAFIDCDLRDVDFGGAVFEKCAFVTIHAAGARFVGMQIASGCFVKECDLAEADFRSAVLQSTSFRGADLTGARFAGARLRGSDFSECDLSGADLSGADAREARFVRANLTGARLQGANLMDAVLQHAILGDTDLRHANLFQGDLARVRVAPGVRFDGALTTRMRTLPRWRPAPAEGSVP